MDLKITEYILNKNNDSITLLYEFYQWLEENYFIKSKELMREYYDCYSQNIEAARKLKLTEAEEIALGSCATMRDIFGNQLI